MEHEQAYLRLSLAPPPRPEVELEEGGVMELNKYEALRLKFSHPRFLGALEVPPFSPHAGGSLRTPNQRRTAAMTPMAMTPDSHTGHHATFDGDD